MNLIEIQLNLNGMIGMKIAMEKQIMMMNIVP